MKITFLVLTFLFNFLFITGQTKPVPAESFLSFLNSYQRDSLENLLTEDFRLVRNYTSFSNDKKTFLQDYVPNSKAYLGSFDIISVLSNEEPVQYLVEDKSGYFKYLKIKNPRWIMTFASKGNRISEVRIDSTASYSAYMMDFQKKNAAFDKWIKEKHQEVTMDSLMKTEGSLIRLLKEYSEQMK
ncbi:hypothetical protein [Ferruginibacter sp. HRS2-29]|uniref:hypothetical protein n=1 Tax=Ferruginibacter sp. HRS2-29 TaxID=2487334 RepID=UPI0020CCC97B|nr:hypothetical protein [Ferruginibacter sp. HRS2-29]MCP9752027.1 hypothetical protein [Ferruginibacter sp. HRS2-29]